MSTNETERDAAETTEGTEPVAEAPAATDASESTGTAGGDAAESSSATTEAAESSSATTEAAESSSATTEAAESSSATTEAGEAPTPEASSGESASKASEAAPVATSSAPSRAGDTKSHAPTAGQRIAAQKAAKAAQKAADRARRAEEAAAALEAPTDELPPGAAPVASAPDALELRTAEVRSLVEKNTNNLAKLGAAVLAGVLVFGGVSMVIQHRARAAGSLLARAVEASRATIGSNDGVNDGRLRFGSEAARDREAMTRYRKVVSEYPSSDAARFARLGIARLLMAEQKFAEAQVEIRAAGEGLEDAPSLEALVEEASALAYTGERKFAEAQRAIDRLARIDRQRYRDVADYLSARVLFDRGDREGAKTKLRALLDRLDDEGAVPHDHVQDQARNLMRQIDPTAVPADSPGQISPELLQMLLQQQGLGGGGQ